MHAPSARYEGCGHTSLRALLAHAIKEVAYQTIPFATGVVSHRRRHSRPISRLVLLGGTILAHMTKAHAHPALVMGEVLLKALVGSRSFASIVETWQAQT